MTLLLSYLVYKRLISLLMMKTHLAIRVQVNAMHQKQTKREDYNSIVRQSPSLALKGLINLKLFAKTDLWSGNCAIGLKQSCYTIPLAGILNCGVFTHSDHRLNKLSRVLMVQNIYTLYVCYIMAQRLSQKLGTGMGN